MDLPTLGSPYSGLTRVKGLCLLLAPRILVLGLPGVELILVQLRLMLGRWRQRPGIGSGGC